MKTLFTLLILLSFHNCSLFDELVYLEKINSSVNIWSISRNIVSIKKENSYMKWMKVLLCLFIVSFYTIHSSSQNTTESLVGNALRYAEEYPIEKVYLHFDNTSYYLGEKIWYKAYIVMSRSISPSPISKVLHVELWNQFGQRIDGQKVQIIDGVACGQFNLLPDNLPGYYEVRAYTHWMLNVGENNYFSRVFPCYATPQLPGEYKRELFKFQLDKRMKTRPETLDRKMQVDFYPEGGLLVEGLLSTVAFQIKPFQDISPKIEGIKVYSPDHQLIDTCHVVHNGMGCFHYNPSKKSGYICFNYKGKDYKYDLPTAKEKGICLSVSRLSEDSITVLVAKNTNCMDTLIVCLASGGAIYQAIEVATDESIVQLKLLLDKLPCGVAQILLLSQAGKPLCQRMFFVNRPEKYVYFRCRKEKRVYAPGEKIELELNTLDNSHKNLSTNFSLAVRSTVDCDLSRLADNARSNLLLSSELKGYIHQPEYYFLPSGKVRDKELDLLLLVQGWTQYDWNKRTHYTSTYVPKYPPEQSLVLEGCVRNRFRKKQPDAEVSMLIQDTMSTVMTTKADANSFFHFPLDEFNGKCAAILLASTKKRTIEKARFFIDRNFTPPLHSYEPEEMSSLWDNLSETDSLALEKEEKTVMEKYKADGNVLDEVLVKRKNKKLPLKEYDRSIFAYYNVEQMVEEYLDKGKKYISLVDFLIQNNTNFKWMATKWIPMNSPMSSKAVIPEIMGLPLEYKNKKTKVFWDVDGRLIGDTVKLNQLLMSNPSGLKSITISEGNAAYKYINASAFNSDDVTLKSTFGGVSFTELADAVLISIKTSHGLTFFLRYPPSSETRVTYIEGYTKPDNFFSSNYANQSLPIVEKDHRRTLYWNPSVQTDKEGKAFIEFYNSNKYSILNINAETVTSDGRTGCLNIY